MKSVRLLFKNFEVKILNRIANHNYCFYVGNSQSDLDDVYRLRFKVYCEEYGYVDRSKHPNKKESDEYDRYSVHFLIRDRERQLIATSRLILSSSLGFPLEKNFKLYFDPKKIPRNQVAEISRLIVVPEHRKQRLMLLLLRGMYTYTRANHINYIYSVMDESLSPRLFKMGFPFHKTGNTAPYQGMTTPYILDIREMIKVLEQRNSLLYDYFKEVDSEIFSYSQGEEDQRLISDLLADSGRSDLS